MERAIKKRLYVYTIGMFLATVVVVSVITIYYEYRVRYMATTLYGVNKEAGKQLLYILFYGRQGHTGTADYSAILQEAGYTRNGAWYMFLYGGEYIPFAVIIGIMVILLAFTIYNIVKIGHNDVYSYMNKLKEDNENISKELGAYRTYMEKRSRQLQDFTENIAHQKIATSFDKYKKNNSLPDIYGYLDIPSSNYRTDMIYISYLKDFDNYPAKSLNMDEFTQVDLINKEYNSRNRYNIPYDELRQLILDNGMTALFTSIPYNSPDRIIKSNCAIMNSPLAKDGNNSIIEGVSSDVIDGLNEIPGIVSIDYSIFESERTWYWDNQDYHKMGIDKIIAAQKASSIAKTMKDPTYGSRYLFATEYVNPTKEIYDIASKYIDKSNINYDDFASGKQVIVFIQDNCEGDYDDTLKAGDTLYYNYYNVPFGQCNKGGYITSSNAVYPYDIPFFNKYNNSGKIDLQVELKDDDNPNTASTTYSFTQTDLEVETMFGACVAPQVAAVIKVTDEVKEDFNGIMPDYGYYTALASTQLAKQAVDNQKDLMLRITGEGLTDGIDFELQYNQIKIDYDLSSTFSATNNKVALYLKSNNITYKSNVDSKNVYRTQLVNNILQYGITIMAVIIIQLLIMAIIIRNRIESRHGKFILFRKMGMTRGKLLGICMCEALRESLWCIVTLPLMLILEVLIYSSNIRKL